MRALSWWAALALFAGTAYAQDPAALPAPEASVVAGPTVEVLSDAELQALGLEAEGPRVDMDFHFWGFIDFTSALQIQPRGAAAVAQGRHQNFYIGNLNVYLSKNLSESFRTMAEVRLTYLPNGSYELGEGGYAQVDTSVIDYANGQSQARWGGIIPQRVYLEWTLHRLLSVRAGQFLTPLGIWNVDHGSPAYIPAQRPLAVVGGLFPERQTGLEVLGQWNANNRQALGYHVTLSNGTGPISEYKDLDRNKAIGGRLYWEYFGDTYVRAGVSGYYGRDTASSTSASITPTTIELGERLNSQSDILTLAADALLKRGGLHLQTEWVTQQRRYTDRGRTLHSLVAAPIAAAASADSFSWLGYVLAAYRFGTWLRPTPFVLFQAGEFALHQQAIPDARASMLGINGGFNVSPIDGVVLKLEFAHLRFPRTVPILKDTVNALLVQVAWAF